MQHKNDDSTRIELTVFGVPLKLTWKLFSLNSEGISGKIFSSFNSIRKLYKWSAYTCRICKKKSLGRPSNNDEILELGRFIFGIQKRQHVNLEAK
jgi:hypothetical protein